MQGLGLCFENGFTDSIFPFSTIMISPFSISLMNLAPTISRAQVSDAKIYELLSFPITKGLIPKGSLIRDPFGIRPLVIGKLNNSYILASETCALDIVGAKFIREIENGEIIIVENGKIESVKPFSKQRPRPCIFEYIYFARPDSLIGGKCAYEYIYS